VIFDEFSIDSGHSFMYFEAHITGADWFAAVELGKPFPKYVHHSCTWIDRRATAHL